MVQVTTHKSLWMERGEKDARDNAIQNQTAKKE
jgi:hypothetical protein